MPSDNGVQQAIDEINERVDDGSGCTETWGTLSDYRNGNQSPGRRTFLKRLGVAVGAIPLGATTTATATENHSNPDDDIEVDATEISGEHAEELIEQAESSTEFQEAAKALGDHPAATEVYEYNLSDESGYGVTFGEEEEETTTIRYYIRDEDVEVIGGKPLDTGMRTVQVIDGSLNLQEIGTQRVQAHTRKVQHAVSRSDRVKEGSISSEEAVIGFESELDGSRKGNRKGRYRGLGQASVMYASVVNEGEVVDRIVVNLTEGRITEDDLLVESAGDDISSHVICVWGACVNYCSVLCATLAGLAGAGCVAKCAGTIAGIPISPACGAICAGVVGGVCYPTCTNQVH